MKNGRDEIDENEADATAQEKQEAVSQAPQDMEPLAQALEQKTREAVEANEKYLRTYADFDNYRKRMQRDMVEFRRYANEQLVFELLTVVDNLGLALKHGAEAGEAVQGMQQGVELVFKQLRDTLEKFGVKKFPAEGEPFDPSKHDAMMQVPTADIPENTVVQVFQDGYLYHDKVLRHAKVSVSKKPQPEPVGAAKEE